jgi:16S rRNA (adenine1518-N6/adenine1519-N6)-dimethyltransferase
MLLTTSELIKKYGLDAKKSLGQNFILDKNFTDKIAKSAGDLSESIVLEVGPGPGSLTRSILDAGVKKLIVIEKDHRCLQALQELQNHYGAARLEIIEGDALEIDEEKLFSDVEKIKIIANLPYNIGTVLIFKWLKIAHKISSMTLMLQKEVVERIVAKPSQNHYGRLAVMVNHMAQSKMLFVANRAIFTPPPKVTSAIVQITPQQKIENIAFEKLEKLVAAAFNQRRKMIKSALKSFHFKDCSAVQALEQCGIDPNLRAENLTIQQFCNLAKIT